MALLILILIIEVISLKNVRRSVNADPKDLIVLCEVKLCERKFLNILGMKTHLQRVHGISAKGRLTIKGETYCSDCKKEFSTEKSYLSHGPLSCKERRSKTWRSLKCQNIVCGKEFEKYVGSDGNRKGQKFCSRDCSQQVRREDIAKKWLKKDPSILKYKIHERFIEYSKKCRTCDKIFAANNPIIKSCSKECIRHVIPDTSNMGGLRPGGGYSKNIEFVGKSGDKMSLNIEEIRVAEFLDSNGFTWRRNYKGFPYIDLEGKSRKFHPDFYIKDLDLYIEYKGWTTPEMLHKMSDADRRNSDLNLLIIVGDSIRFAEHGICISDLEKDISLLKKMSY